MSSEESEEPDEGQHQDKGKGRLELPPATERTPLLASPSYSQHDDVETNADARRGLVSKLTVIFFTTLILCVFTFFILALVAYSYAARVSKVSPSDLLDNALVVKGPDRVDVLNITEDGRILVRVEGRVGIDAGSILGVHDEGEDDGIIKAIWKSVGRWGIERVDTVSVQLSTVHISSKRNYTNILASMDMPPFQLSLAADPPLADSSWLQKVSIPLSIHYTNNVTTLTEFVRESWQDGTAAVKAHVGKVTVHGGSVGADGWKRKVIQAEHTDVLTMIRIKMPSLPGIPSDGPLPSVAELITLQKFGISSESNKLVLTARATVVNPLPLTMDLTVPKLPFVVSLFDNAASVEPIPVASVVTEPFLPTYPNITLSISGTVLSLPSDSSPILSGFLSRYLSQKTNPVMISTPLFPEATVITDFPAPPQKPQILQDVTIHNMKILPTGPGGTFLASGTVFARIVLPEGMDVNLEANRVFPDVLVFDGEVPNYAALNLGFPYKDDAELPTQPLPDPLPERAFAHIRPDDWLSSLSIPDESREGEGSSFTVTADIVDVPLEVLPGRQREFSGFVRKVVFGKQGALAGISGFAAVAVHVEGLAIGNWSGGEMELTGLPFQGSVRVGKKDLLTSETNNLRKILGKLPRSQWF